MEILASIGGLFLVLAVVFLGRTVVNVRRRRVMRACGSSVCSLSSVAIAAPVLLLVFNFYSYARLTDERLVCQVHFSQVATNEFAARLMIAGQHDRIYRLLGNEWQIDARLVNWKPPLTILGLDPIYQLERISGRYSEIDREQTEPRTVHALSADNPIDVLKIAGKYPFLMPGVDAYYGTATYVPMADGARFAVSLSRDALIARPANDIARAVVRHWNNGAR
jgi:hypothetical protein